MSARAAGSVSTCSARANRLCWAASAASALSSVKAFTPPSLRPSSRAKVTVWA